MRVDQWLKLAREAMTDNPDAAWDADFMMCDILSCERGRLRFVASEMLTAAQETQLAQWLSRRTAGEPLQYVLGYTYFWGLRFACDGRALIPRQDTETLVDEALKAIRGRKQPRILDLCCGTGCIGLSMAHERPDAQVTLCDLSEKALALARENARALGLSVAFYQGDLFQAVSGQQFDLILTNPPYLTAGDMGELQKEVRLEPEMALFGGADGLDFYRRIAKDAPTHLSSGGALMMECGQGQAGAAASLCEGWGRTGIVRDLCGIERVVTVTKER